MIDKIPEKIKKDAIVNMTKNLSAFRTMLHLTQADLAELIGVGRQTVICIENGTRPLTYGNYLSLMFVFSQYKETEQLLRIFGAYPKELEKIYTEIDDKRR